MKSIYWEVKEIWIAICLNKLIEIEEDTPIHNAKGLSKCINQRKSQLYCPDKVLSESKLSKLLENLPTKILIFFAKLMNGIAGSV